MIEIAKNIFGCQTRAGHKKRQAAGTDTQSFQAELAPNQQAATNREEPPTADRKAAQAKGETTMTQRKEVDDCGCKRIIYTNKRDNIETVHGFPCEKHNSIEHLKELFQR